MTRQEVMEKLDALVIPYDRRLKVESLIRLLPPEAIDKPKDLQAENKPVTIDVEKAIEEGIMGAAKVGLEKSIATGTRDDDGITTKTGIIIPQTVLNGYQKLKWVYYADHYADKSVVIKKPYATSPKTEEVRTYTLEIHGENFKKLAEQFVDKNNR